jgi:hypothetical protein
MAKLTTPLSEWNKTVKKALIDRNMTIKELSIMIGYSDTYTRNVVNGKIVGAVAAENRINEVLDLK